jgi:hypothetical protein
MLWGGLLMVAAIVLLLAFVNRDAQRIGAAVGGAGFGTFIDEVGKFVTRDNDYFFQPSFALMYVVFIVVVIAGQSILRRIYTPTECLTNALREIEELALLDFDAHERGRALRLLDQSDAKNPLVERLRQIVLEAPDMPHLRPGRYALTREFIRNQYERFVNHQRFQVAVVGFFAAQLLFRLVVVILVVFFPWMLPSPEGEAPRHVGQRLQDLTLADWGQLVSTGVSGVLVTAGIVALARSRRFAYRLFKSSILVTIFITQFFMFYEEQLSAIVGLGLNLLLLAAVQGGLDLERTRSAAMRVELGRVVAAGPGPGR